MQESRVRQSKQIPRHAVADTYEVEVGVFAPVVAVSWKLRQPHLHDNPHHAQHSIIVQVLVRGEAESRRFFQVPRFCTASLCRAKHMVVVCLWPIPSYKASLKKKWGGGRGRGVEEKEGVIHQAKEQTRTNKLYRSAM